MDTIEEVETSELELLDVQTELDDGVDTEVLMHGVLETSLGELAIAVVGVGDLIEVVTELNVMTLSKVETTELELPEVQA